jgi:3-phosphoshikimate 1-carboxyvinyltransferase
MVENLRCLGARMEIAGPELRVMAPVAPKLGEVRRVTAAGDHRIAMAMAVTALHAGPLELDDPGCVSKSFPGFWEAWRTVAGEARAGSPLP